MRGRAAGTVRLAPGRRADLLAPPMAGPAAAPVPVARGRPDVARLVSPGAEVVGPVLAVQAGETPSRSSVSTKSSLRIVDTLV